MSPAKCRYHRPTGLLSRALLLSVACGAAAVAQSRVELGVRAGLPLRGPMIAPPTVTFTDTYHIWSSSPRHLSVGASISIAAPRRTRIRLEPAYQRIGVTETGVVESDVGVNIVKIDTAANRWRLPIFWEAEVAPHIRLGIGPEVSVVTGSHAMFEQRHPMFYIQPAPIYLHIPKRVCFGIAASVEFPFRLGPVTLAPEIRYTRWTGKHYGGISAMDEVATGLAFRF
jgi:hypothetical protein